MERSWTLNLGGVVALMGRSGGAQRMPILTPNIAYITCTEVATVQESLWNHNLSPNYSYLHHNLSPQHSITGRSKTPSLSLGSSSSLQLHMDPGPLESRYLCSTKPGMAEHTFRTETSGSARGLGIYGIDNLWQLTSPRVSSWPLPKFSTPYSVQTTYPHFPAIQDLCQATLSPVSRQQHSFITSEVDAPVTTKHEGQFLLPFFDEWPQTRESWCNLEEDRSKRASISTTQLSMTFPIATSDISTSSSKSSKSESASSRTDLLDMI